MIRPPLENNHDALETNGAAPLRQLRLPHTLGRVGVRRLTHRVETAHAFEGHLPPGYENLCVSLDPFRSAFSLDGRTMLREGGPLGSFAIGSGMRLTGRHWGRVDFVEFRIGVDDLPAVLADHGVGPGTLDLHVGYRPADQPLQHALAQLRTALTLLPRLDALYLDTLLEACLGQLVRRHVMRTGRIERRPSLSPTAVKRVIAFIDANLARILRLEELAGVAGISRAHFARAFHAETGFTPHRYVMRRRVETALRAMAHREPTLAAIAKTTGFADHAHMTRTFRQQLRVAPSAAREMLANRLRPARDAAGRRSSIGSSGDA